MTSNAFEHQVAGHPEQLILSDDPSQLIKRCNDRELQFYSDLLAGDGPDWKQEFLRFLPTVYAIEQERSSLVLENLVFGYTRPCIVDIKLGTVLYHESATPEKQSRMEKVAKETTSGSLGFRICGMKVRSGCVILLWIALLKSHP